MAVNEEKNKKYYSYLTINKTKRAGLILLCFLGYSLFFFLIARGVFLEQGWKKLLAPILLVALPIVLYPPIQIWAYRPWQAKPRKDEQNYFE